MIVCGRRGKYIIISQNRCCNRDQNKGMGEEGISSSGMARKGIMEDKIHVLGLEGVFLQVDGGKDVVQAKKAVLRFHEGMKPPIKIIQNKNNDNKYHILLLIIVLI